MSTAPRDLILYGAGGFGREVASMTDRGATGTSGCHDGSAQSVPWRVVAFVDDTPDYKGKTIHGVRCLGSFTEAVAVCAGNETWCHATIGDNEDRMKAAQRIKAAGWKPATVVHNSAYLSWEVKLGAGCFLGPYVTVSPNVDIGEHVLINTRAAIGHHAVIGNFAQISLNASVLGHGRVDKGAMVGAHAVVMSDVTVGPWATVAIGTPVLRSVKPGHTVCLPLARTIFERKLPPED